MIKYTIEAIIDGIDRKYEHASLGHMVVAFAQDINTALDNGKSISGCYMYNSVSGVQLVYGFKRILLIGAAISGLPIASISPEGTVLQFINAEDLFSASKRMELKWPKFKITMTLIGVTVTLTPDWLEQTEITTWLCNWEFLVRGFKRTEKYHNEVPQPAVSTESVDNDWMLEYYVRNELKKIKELIDTDIQEAKKRISVMEYMINSKVKN